MGTPGVGGRRRMTTKLHSAAEDQALDIIAKEAEARLAAKRAARVEAREIRMRELEKQQKQADEQSDRHFELLRDPVQTIRQQTGVRTSSHGSPSFSGNGSRRGSEDSTDMDSREIRHQLTDTEEKFRKAMINNAQMENEKSTLVYQVDDLRDEMEELEETHYSLQKEHKEKCRELERTKKEVTKAAKDNDFLKMMIEQRDKLIEEHGLVIVDESGDMRQVQSSADRAKVALVSQEAAQFLEQAGEGTLDVRLRRFAEEKQELLDEIRRLKLDLEEERQKSKIEKLTTQSPQSNGPDMKLLEVQRETSKVVSDYKFRLQKAEQEVSTLQGNVARLESQVTRFKSSADAAEKLEDELKADKRKLQREVRESQSKIEELETANNHLQKRIDKLKSVRNTLVK